MTKAANKFLKKMSEINFNQCHHSGILKTPMSALWRTSLIDQDATLFALLI